MSEDSGILIINEQNLKEKIHIIRGQQVMLDCDLAEIYGYTTKAFNQQVKRNIDRFPEDFMFQLTPEEASICLKSQIVTLNDNGNKRGLHIKKMPYVFNESGIYMLMTVLKGDLAIEQSKKLIRLFKSMKDYIIENQQIMITQKDYFTLAKEVIDNTADIKVIKESMVKKTDLSDFMKLFDTGTVHEEILILDGQPLKADIAFQKIYGRAKRKLLVIDDYISVKTLQHLAYSKANIAVNIITDNKGSHPLRMTEYQDFQAQYPGRKVKFIMSEGKLHDRYIFLDYGTREMKVFHCGSSSKDAGKRVTTITRLMDLSGYKEMVLGLLTKPELELS